MSARGYRVSSSLERSDDCVVVRVAEHSAQVLASAMLLARQLHRALTRRAVIDLAIGIVAARSGRGTDDAFTQLHLLTQEQHITLVEVCQRIVDDAIAAADT
jgi:AmiR/NasT family two-component response regulator